MATNETVKSRLLSIFANYHSAFVSNSSTSDEKYYIDTDNETSFNHLVTLIKNIEFKSTDDYDSAETAISSEIGKLLIKYCELGLSDDDVYTLLQIVYMYNSHIKTLFNFGGYEEFGSSGTANYYVSTLLRYCFEAIPDANGIMTSTSSGGYYGRLCQNISRCYVERKFYSAILDIESRASRVLAAETTSGYKYITEDETTLVFYKNGTVKKILKDTTDELSIQKSDIWNLYFSDLHDRYFISDFEYGVFSHMNSKLITTKTDISTLINSEISSDETITVKEFIDSVSASTTISDYVKSIVAVVMPTYGTSITLSAFKSSHISDITDYYWTAYVDSSYAPSTDGWRYVKDESYVTELVGSLNDGESDFVGACAIYFIYNYVYASAVASSQTLGGTSIESPSNLFETEGTDGVITISSSYDATQVMELLKANINQSSYVGDTIAGVNKQSFIFSGSSSSASFLTDSDGNEVYVSAGGGDVQSFRRIASSTFYLCDYMINPFGSASESILRFRKTKYGFFLYQPATGASSTNTEFITPSEIAFSGLTFYVKISGNNYRELKGYRLGLRKIDDGVKSAYYEPSDYSFSTTTTYSVKEVSDCGTAKKDTDLAKLYWSMCTEYISDGITDGTYDGTKFKEEAAMGPSYVSSNELLSRGSDSLCEMTLPSSYSKIRQNALSIIYDFESASNTATESRKVTDEDISKYGTQQYQAIFKLSNISLPDTDEHYSSRLELVNNLISAKNYTSQKGDLVSDVTTETNGAQHTTSYFTIFILYKELNIKYRTAEESALSEMLFSSYYTTKERDLAYSYLISEYRTYSDTAVMSSDNINVVRDTFTNPYHARVGKKFDIIAYKSGEAIGYGTDSTEEKEIDSFLQLYKSTRDYYYGVQFNKAFALDEMYDFYSLMYIIGFSMDRWYGNKLSEFRNVDSYDINDCAKFFDSYGLSEVSSTLKDSSSVFYNQLDYCKKIISNYSDLIKYKGSKKIVSLLSSIFYNDSTKITITKYLIFHDLSSGNDGTGAIKFIEVGYDESNAPAVISNEFNHAKPYADTIANDIYWNGKVTEDEVKTLDISPQTTKYIGITAQNDISKKFIKTRYTVSMMEYLRDKLYSATASNNAITNSLYKIQEEVSLTIGGTTSKTVLNVCTLIEMGETLMALYHHLQDLLDGIYTSGVTKTITNASPKYYGINKTIGAVALIKSITGATDASTTSLYGYLHGHLSTGTSTMLSDDDYYYSDYTLKSESWESEMNDQIGNIDNSYKSSDFYFIPLHDASSSKSDFYTLNKDNSRLLDYFDELYKADVSATDRLTSVSDIESILQGISLMTLLNSVTGTTDAKAKQRFYRFNALYLYDRTIASSSSAIVYSNVGELISNTELSLSSTIGGTVITAAIGFPNDYLYGQYEERLITKLSPKFIDKTVKNYMDGIFDNMYLCDEAPIGYSATYTVNAALYKSFNLIESSDSEKLASILKFMFSGIYTANTGETEYTINSDFASGNTSPSVGAITDAIDTVSDRILSLDTYLSDLLTGIENLLVQYSVSEDSDELLAFVVKLIKEFMSYTTSVRNVSVNNVYDNEGETIPYAGSFKEDISNTAGESLYYDEKVSMILTRKVA